MMRQAVLHCLLLSLGVVPISAAAQTQTAIAVGATWLDFGSAWGSFAAATGQVRVRRGALELTTAAVLPTQVAAAIPGCVVGAPCIERSTPDALFALVASAVKQLGVTGWRVSAGAGWLATTGMKGPGDHSSPVGSLGLEWTTNGRRGLTLGVRALALTSDLEGLRYVVVPGIGVRF